MMPLTQMRKRQSKFFCETYAVLKQFKKLLVHDKLRLDREGL